MAELEQVKTSNDKRHRFVAFVPLLALLWLGSMGFYRVATNARFESYHTLDVVQLLISGASFGVVLAFLIVMFVWPHVSQAHKS
jgi:hypothetical protein